MGILTSGINKLFTHKAKLSLRFGMEPAFAAKLSRGFIENSPMRHSSFLGDQLNKAIVTGLNGRRPLAAIAMEAVMDKDGAGAQPRMREEYLDEAYIKLLKIKGRSSSDYVYVATASRERESNGAYAWINSVIFTTYVAKIDNLIRCPGMNFDDPETPIGPEKPFILQFKIYWKYEIKTLSVYMNMIGLAEDCRRQGFASGAIFNPLVSWLARNVPGTEVEARAMSAGGKRLFEKVFSGAHPRHGEDVSAVPTIEKPVIMQSLIPLK